MATTIALVTDLIFSTKITGTAKALGGQVTVARSLDRLREVLAGPTGGAAPAAAQVIVDLNASAVDVMEAIRLAKQHGARVVAFLSHVQVNLAAAAREAGADQVLARSAFVERLPQILAGD